MQMLGLQLPGIMRLQLGESEARQHLSEPLHAHAPIALSETLPPCFQVVPVVPIPQAPACTMQTWARSLMQLYPMHGGSGPTHHATSPASLAIVWQLRLSTQALRLPFPAWLGLHLPESGGKEACITWAPV